MKKMRCKFCDKDHLEIRKEIREVEIKGKNISYEFEYYFCPDMEEEFEEGELINLNLSRARDAYRKAKGLLTIQDIVDIREKLNLSQKDLAILLGMGEITITRIESKTIQDKSTDDSIRRIAVDPLFLLEKLELNREKLGKKYTVVKTLLNQRDEISIYLKRILNIYYMEISKDKNMTGNMNLNLQKIENMILYFLKNCHNVYKTKLNKLIWFADFRNYQKSDESITGLAYIHKPYGAVPVGIDEMLKCFESIEIEEIENEEKGYTYFEIKPLRNPDLSIFTSDELETLKSIGDKFKNFGNREISDYMHLETAHVETVNNENIEYKFARFLREI